MSILIKIPRGKFDLPQLKNNIHSSIDELMREKEFRSVRCIIDVDPV
jgi:hypothetical protein